MTDREYNRLQEDLRKHLKTAHGYTGNKKEIFKEGIMVAMSMLHQLHEHPIEKE